MSHFRSGDAPSIHRAQSSKASAGRPFAMSPMWLAMRQAINSLAVE
jgi:hypothetical protein